MEKLEYYQNLYDQGKSLNTICKECPEAKRFFLQKNLKFRSHKESSKGHSWGIPLSKDRRSVISAKLKKSHAEGKHPGWNHINSDSGRMSYPEKFIKSVLENNNIFSDFTVIQHIMPIGKYFLDFAIIETKIDIEVDGEQHFRTETAVEHDRIRNEYLINNGWKVYRIRWSDMCKNSKEHIESLINFIRLT